MSDGQTSDEPIYSPQEAYDAARHVSAEMPCPYLSGRMARSEAYLAEALDGVLYESLLARGFRRSGRIVYRPRCRGCQECRQLRVPVREFTPSRSMRRITRRNADVRVEAGAPAPTAEKHRIYQAYLYHQHDGTMSGEYDAFLDFLYDAPIEAMEFRYLLGERLVGVSLVDCCPNGLSSVYMFYDPRHGARSLGTYSILWEIDYCRRQGLGYYYLGFYVAGSKTMEYKARFRPNQILVGSDRWITFRE